MNTGTFRPSIDWSHEFVNSILWISVAFVITAPCLLLALVLIARLTEWGRQFWRVTGAYFIGRQSLVVWMVLALLLFFTIITVRISVLISFYSNDVFTSLQVALQGIATGRTAVTDSGIHGFWVTIGIFLILAVVHVIVTLLDIYVTQRFIMRWRIWLSGRLIDDWLGDFAYYRRQFLRRPNDNPDQRIQQDIDIFTTGVGGQTNNPMYDSGSTLLFGGVAAMLSVFAFGAILWRLSGALTLGGFTLPRALFWIVIVYVLAATVIAFVIGRPLIRLSYLNELRNAGFRYALVRVRDASAAIGLYRGERVERRLLGGRLSEVMANYGGWLNRMVRFKAWNLTVSQAINPLPFVVQAPRLFAGEISFGDVIQSATAFTTIHNALSFFREAYDSVRELSRGGDPPRRAGRGELAGPHVRTGGDIGLRGRPVGGRRRRGSHTRRRESSSEHLISASGRVTRCWSVDRPASARRSCCRASPGCGRSCRAAFVLPSGRQAVMFVPQLPYLPLGDLRAVVSYPNEEGTVDDRAIQQALIKVALPQLAIRLNDVGEWAKVLVGRRATADRFRAHPGDQARRGVPRRVDLGARRGTRADAVRTDPDRTPRHDFGQRESPRHRRAIPRPPAGACRRRPMAAGATDHPQLRPFAELRLAGRGTLPGWICSPQRWTGATSSGHRWSGSPERGPSRR